MSCSGDPDQGHPCTSGCSRGWRSFTAELGALAAIPPPEIPMGMCQPPLSCSQSPQGSVDCPSLEFEYGDADGHGAELGGEMGFGAVLLLIGACRGGKIPVGN